MTRNEKLSEILIEKLDREEKTYLIGDDFHLEGIIRIVSIPFNTVSIQTSIGNLTISYDKISTII